MVVVIKRDGFEWTQHYAKGKPTTKLTKGKPTKQTGTCITFKPDPEIFEDVTILKDEIRKNVQDRAYLNSGLKIIFNDETFHYNNGLISFIKDVNDKPLFEPIYLAGKHEYVPKNLKHTIKIEFEIAFNYSKNEGDNNFTFCNGINTIEGGTHLKAFRMALSETIKKYIVDNNILTKQEKNLEITGEDIRENLYCIVAVKHTEPKYESQTKIKVSNSDIEGPIRKLMNNEFYNYLLQNPNVSKIICKNVIISAKSRLAAKCAKNNVLKKESKQNNFILNDAGKLADCLLSDNTKTELIIVEGK
jgi:DNA gyrase subunit B